jgi:hypothetical protein
MTILVRTPIKPKPIALHLSNPTTFHQAITSGSFGDISLQGASVLARYYSGIQKAQTLLERQRNFAPPALFEPSRTLPLLSEEMIRLFEPAKMEWSALGKYKGRSLKLLKLLGDPATNTAKTFASLVMIARAVHHIQQTGENILILVTTSGNKGTALRSAVERALSLGLVKKEQLRVVIIVPQSSAHKLRFSHLYADDELRRLNPVVLYKGESSTRLKQLGQAFQEKYFTEFVKQTNTRIWYSLNLDNYQVPDSARAYFEYENRLLEESSLVPATRLHVHTVSSAFGFIGYHLGRSVLVQEGLTTWEENPGYFLVQHLKTPDMVLHNYFGSFSSQHRPEYHFDETTGLYVQCTNAHFPEKTLTPYENLDATFYSSTPSTSPYVSGMIEQFGGGGIVVSLHECLERFPLVRSLLSRANLNIVADPRRITEWASLIALTGILNAIDREIIPEQAELVIHASGYYALDVEYTPLCAAQLPTVNDDEPYDQLRKLVTGIE